MTDEKKEEEIKHHFKQIMLAMGLDLTNDSLIDTPKRVAKMFVHEIFSGLNETKFPRITTVQNEFRYDQMLISKNIEVKSVCEHHFVPIIGKAHIAYIPKEKVLGLSKFNRITDYYSRRPQVQERLTQQIKNKLVEVLGTEDVAVTIDAIHYCVRMRGVQNTEALTRTSALGGSFKTCVQTREEYHNAIGSI